MKKREYKKSDFVLFPWGDILLQIFDINNPQHSREIGEVIKVLTILREYTSDTAYRWVTTEECPLDVNGKEEFKKELTNFANKGIDKAKIVPKRILYPWEKKVIAAGDEWVKKLGFQTIYECIVTAATDSKASRKIGYSLNRTFRISTRKTFEEFGVEQAVDKFIEKKNKSSAIINQTKDKDLGADLL